MSTQQATPLFPRSWLNYLLPIFFIWMTGVDMASLDSRCAQDLSLPYAFLVDCTPFIGLLLYVSIGTLLRARLGRAAWFLGFVVGFVVIFVPHNVNAHYTQAVPASRWLEPNETRTLEAHASYPCFFINKDVVIRRSDDATPLIEYLRSINAYQEHVAK